MVAMAPMLPPDALPSARIRGDIAITAVPPRPGPRRFLFLQGPISPFFLEVARGLAAQGHAIHRIHLSFGDRLFWGRVEGQPPAAHYQGRPADWPAFIAAYLDRHGITDILLLGEQRAYHRAAIAAAATRGIAVVVTDFGYFRPDWITLERDGMGGDSRFPRDPARITALARSLPPADLTERLKDDFGRQAAWDVIYNLANLAPWPFRHYRSHQLHHPLATYWGIARRLLRRRAERAEGERALAAIGDRPFWLFAMQMETDFSVRAYSRYPDLDTPITETLRSFAAHAPAEGHLLVKVHPLDPCVKRWTTRIGRLAAAEGLSGRVHVAHNGSLDEMVLGMRGLVTINSTVGLKAVVFGKPVKALGIAVWDLPGLAHQGTLDSFWTEAAAPDPAFRADFLAALQATTQLRGVFYGKEGRAVAVAAATRALHEDRVGAFLPPVTVPGAALPPG
jgi:capsular polysaccharide export protein